MKLFLLILLSLVAAVIVTILITSATVFVVCEGYEPAWFCSVHGGMAFILAIGVFIISIPICISLIAFRIKK